LAQRVTPQPVDFAAVDVEGIDIGGVGLQLLGRGLARRLAQAMKSVWAASRSDSANGQWEAMVTSSAGVRMNVSTR
jgi:hypothetical protein